ncbi:MAG: signal peptidase II [bacterium]|nr:signal peptidase II [Candidatus Kapabacteria bacterium]
MRKYLGISLLIVILDQATKIAVKGFDLFGMRHDGMHLYESIQVIRGSDVLRWTFVENPGMAFGLNFGMPVVLSLFSIAASIFLVRMLISSKRHKSKGLAISLALILAGAVGNLIDRVFYGVAYGYSGLFYGKVVDFVDVDLPDLNILGFELHRFYVFNVADAAVSVGVVLLLIFYPSKSHEHNVVPSGGTPALDTLNQPAAPAEAPNTIDQPTAADAPRIDQTT